MSRIDEYSKTGWDGTAFHPDEEFLSEERERIKEIPDSDVVEYILFGSPWSEAFRGEEWKRCGNARSMVALDFLESVMYNTR